MVYGIQHFARRQTAQTLCEPCFPIENRHRSAPRRSRVLGRTQAHPQTFLNQPRQTKAPLSRQALSLSEQPIVDIERGFHGLYCTDFCTFHFISAYLNRFIFTTQLE
jgi:hypothetical protein